MLKRSLNDTDIRQEKISLPVQDSVSKRSLDIICRERDC